MANIDRSKKLLVRSALVAGSTIAAMIGAQTLAVLDQRVVTASAAQTDTQNIIDTSGGVVVLRATDNPQTNIFSSEADDSTTISSASQSTQTNPAIVQTFRTVTTRSSR